MNNILHVGVRMCHHLNREKNMDYTNWIFHVSLVPKSRCKKITSEMEVAPPQKLLTLLKLLPLLALAYVPICIAIWLERYVNIWQHDCMHGLQSKKRD